MNVFLFQVLPTIIFFSALTSVLFYLGIIQKVVRGLAWLLSKLLKISGAESLSVAGNVFLGQTEAPLMIKAYLEKMSKSEYRNDKSNLVVSIFWKPITLDDLAKSWPGHVHACPPKPNRHLSSSFSKPYQM